MSTSEAVSTDGEKTRYHVFWRVILTMDNDIVLVTVCVVLALHVFLSVVMMLYRWAYGKVPLYSYCVTGNSLRSTNAYLVTVVTGSRPDSGTAGNVRLSLHGRNAITDPFIIDTMAFKAQSNRFVLDNCGRDAFLITYFESLGDIQFVQVELSTVNHQEDWYLCYITVLDLSSKSLWYVACHDWLSATKSTPQTMVLLLNAEQICRLWLDNFFCGFRELHVWIAPWCSFLQVTRLQTIYNLTLCYSILCCFMFTHVLIFYAPFGDIHVKHRDLSHYSTKELSYLMIATIFSSLIITLLQLLMRIISLKSGAFLLNYSIVCVDHTVQPKSDDDDNGNVIFDDDGQQTMGSNDGQQNSEISRVDESGNVIYDDNYTGQPNSSMSRVDEYGNVIYGDNYTGQPNSSMSRVDDYGNVIYDDNYPGQRNSKISRVDKYGDVKYDENYTRNASGSYFREMMRDGMFVGNSPKFDPIQVSLPFRHWSSRNRGFDDEDGRTYGGVQAAASFNSDMPGSPRSSEKRHTTYSFRSRSLPSTEHEGGSNRNYNCGSDEALELLEKWKSMWNKLNPERVLGNDLQHGFEVIDCKEDLKAHLNSIIDQIFNEMSTNSHKSIALDCFKHMLSSKMKKFLKSETQLDSFRKNSESILSDVKTENMQDFSSPDDDRLHPVLTASEEILSQTITDKAINFMGSVLESKVTELLQQQEMIREKILGSMLSSEKSWKECNEIDFYFCNEKYSKRNVQKSDKFCPFKLLYGKRAQAITMEILNNVARATVGSVHRCLLEHLNEMINTYIEAEVPRFVSSIVDGICETMKQKFSSHDVLLRFNIETKDEAFQQIKNKDVPNISNHVHKMAELELMALDRIRIDLRRAAIAAEFIHAMSSNVALNIHVQMSRMSALRRYLPFNFATAFNRTPTVFLIKQLLSTNVKSFRFDLIGRIKDSMLETDLIKIEDAVEEDCRYPSIGFDSQWHVILTVLQCMRRICTKKLVDCQILSPEASSDIESSVASDMMATKSADFICMSVVRDADENLPDVLEIVRENIYECDVNLLKDLGSSLLMDRAENGCTEHLEMLENMRAEMLTMVLSRAAETVAIKIISACEFGPADRTQPKDFVCDESKKDLNLTIGNYDTSLRSDPELLEELRLIKNQIVQSIKLQSPRSEMANRKHEKLNRNNQNIYVNSSSSSEMRESGQSESPDSNHFFSKDVYSHISDLSDDGNSSFPKSNDFLLKDVYSHASEFSEDDNSQYLAPKCVGSLNNTSENNSPANGISPQSGFQNKSFSNSGDDFYKDANIYNKSTDPARGNGSMSTDQTRGNGSMSTDPARGNGSTSTDPARGNRSMSTDQTRGNGSMSTDRARGNGSMSTDPARGNGSMLTDPARGNGSMSTDPARGNGSMSTDPARGNGSMLTDPARGNGSMSTDPARGNGSMSTDQTRGNGRTSRKSAYESANQENSIASEISMANSSLLTQGDIEASRPSRNTAHEFTNQQNSIASRISTANSSPRMVLVATDPNSAQVWNSEPRMRLVAKDRQLPDMWNEEKTFANLMMMIMAYVLFLFLFMLCVASLSGCLVLGVVLSWDDARTWLHTVVITVLIHFFILEPLKVIAIAFYFAVCQKKLIV